jgi:hypothetical protein
MSRALLEDYENDDENLYFANTLCPHLTAYLVPLEKRPIQCLKWIIDQIPYLKICLSSTWRLEPDMREFLIASLKAGNIDTDNVVIGDTPALSCFEGRGKEIRQWLDSHSEYSNNFVIVDDGHVESFEKWELTHRFVKTIMHGDEWEDEGLNMRAAEKIVSILKGKN